MAQHPTIGREEAAPLIKAGKLKPAFLYEPEQAPEAKFVFVILAPGLKRLYRYV
jgi:hypothetical protein